MVGDCFIDDDGRYYLALGDTIFWDHLYTVGSIQVPLVLVSSSLLSQQVMSVVHQLVYEYYTTYGSVIELYLPHTISSLLQKKQKFFATKSKPNYPSLLYQGSQFLRDSVLSHGQQMIVMPDWWSIVHYASELGYDMKDALGSQHTSNQDISWFWGLKSGGKNIIVCTPGECFWDFTQLQQIVLVDPHKWYYKSQKDPRYDIFRVCELIAHQFGCGFVVNV